MCIVCSKYFKDRWEKGLRKHQDVHSDYFGEVELQVYLIYSFYFSVLSKFFTEEIDKVFVIIRKKPMHVRLCLNRIIWNILLSDFYSFQEINQIWFEKPPILSI